MSVSHPEVTQKLWDQLAGSMQDRKGRYRRAYVRVRAGEKESYFRLPAESILGKEVTSLR